MNWDPTDLQNAIVRQDAAAQDPASEIRVVAGPGTGKSYVIEARVAHLLKQGVRARNIFAVSFTRASTADLRSRVNTHCQNLGLVEVGDVSVSTLHSLAMKLLKVGNLLGMYPVEPKVLDDWEMEHWIDAEFAQFASVTPTRARDVRRFHEAWWSAGHPNPANYVPPDPPISQHEQTQFAGYHAMQTGFYACVFVGEIIRACLENIRSGTLDPRQLLHLDQLIVTSIRTSIQWISISSTRSLPTA